MRKYRNVPTEVDGIRFASKAEAARYGELKLLEKAGEIRGLKLQPRFIVVDGYNNGEGKRIRPASYIADFQYIEDGKTIVEDVKSPASKTPLYLLKKKLFEQRYHPLVIREIGG